MGQKYDLPKSTNKPLKISLGIIYLICKKIKIQKIWQKNMST